MSSSGESMNIINENVLGSGDWSSDRSDGSTTSPILYESTLDHSSLPPRSSPVTVPTISHPSSILPSIRINNDLIISKGPRAGRRKQSNPHRSLKQLASVADKIMHGIIVIEPLFPWEKDAGSRLGVSDGGRRGKGRYNSRDEGADESDDVSLGSPHFNSARPTVTRSPASMGIPLAEDSQEPGVSTRQAWYEHILNKKRLGPSRSGMPLDITIAPGASLLDQSEFEVCSTLRLYPLQYFQSRDTLVGNYRSRGFYKKSAAQKMLHIDVNKTGKLYDYFVGRGWLPEGQGSRVTKSPPDVHWTPIQP